MRLEKTLRWIALCFLVVGSASNAQHPLILNKLNAWNDASPQPPNDVLHSLVQEKAQEIYAGDDVCSRSQLSIVSVGPATADRFAFTGLIQGRLKNAWFVVTRNPDCEDSTTRYMIIQNIDDSFHTVRVNRGNSYAWESLIGDTFPLAKIAAVTTLMSNQIDCAIDSDAELGVVRVSSEDEQLGEDTFGIRYSGSWSEIWPISVCGRVVEVFVSFRADGDGGAYSDLPGDKRQILP